MTYLWPLEARQWQITSYPDGFNHHLQTISIYSTPLLKSNRISEKKRMKKVKEDEMVQIKMPTQKQIIGHYNGNSVGFIKSPQMGTVQDYTLDHFSILSIVCSTYQHWPIMMVHVLFAKRPNNMESRISLAINPALSLGNQNWKQISQSRPRKKTAIDLRQSTLKTE